MDGSNNNEIPRPARVHQSGTKQNLIYSLLINTAEICKYEVNRIEQDSHCMWPFAGRSSSKTIDRLLEDHGAYELLDFIITQLSRHPFLAFGMSMCVLSCALPFIVFMVFAIATVLMTFTGFVIIEGKFQQQIETFAKSEPKCIICFCSGSLTATGTLITIASALLFGFLGAVILFFLFFGFVMLAGYFGLMQIYDIVDYPGKRRAFVSYLRRNGRDAPENRVNE